MIGGMGSMRSVQLFLLLLHSAALQHLAVETSRGFLLSCFDGLGDSVAATLHRKLFPGTYRQQLRTGSLEAHSIYCTDLLIRDAAIVHNEEGHFFKLTEFDLQLSGSWRYEVVFVIRDEGNFTLNIRGMNVTIGPIVPEQYEGLPFLASDVNCSLRFANFDFQIVRPGAMTNVLSNLMHSVMRWKIEKTICAEVTSAVDSFLRIGVQKLLLRHSLSTGAVFNNSVVRTPELSARGDLTTYHAGTLDGETPEEVPFAILHEARQSDATFFIAPQMVQQILLAVHRGSLFDGVFEDNIEYSLNVTTVRPPSVTLLDDGLLMTAEQRYVLRKDGLLASNRTFPINVTLRIFYSPGLQLLFQVTRDAEWSFLGAHLRQKFAFKLNRHLRAVVRTHVRLPLPTASGILADHATIRVQRGLIVVETALRRAFPSDARKKSLVCKAKGS